METAQLKPTVLVVDDSLTNRALLSKILSADFDVEQAENGAAALEKLRAAPSFAAVILDIEMPVLDGYGVLAAMRADARLREIPVVVDTANDDLHSQLKALDGGAADILIKPFNPQIALHRVRNLVARQEAARQAARARNLEQLLRQSEIDEKTGLFTRQAFCRKAAEMMGENPGEEYVILRWDIDHFKVYNDMFGVKAGDDFLALVGKTLLPYMDDRLLFGHYSADHFVACMTKKRFTEHNAARQILDSHFDVLPGFELFVRLGVYEVRDLNVSVELMCDRALLALRSIKGDYTRRAATYDDSMRKAMLEEQEIISEMDRALSGRQFVVYLQPQYNYSTNAMHGAEALVRWKHPVKGLIPPDRFIPIFERSGFISHMDEYVWEEACRLQQKWLSEGLRVVPVSVNISRRDIYNPRLCEHITGLVKKYGLSPDLLHLEITESAYMDNAAQLIRTVGALRSAGFIVEMDDFGSGYSSLNTLKDVPVDMLKLDMKFLRDSAGNAKGGNILTSVIRMAQWIRLPVIAEGVETREQADYLKSVGCHYMQGYYFARPMSSEDFEALLRGGKTDSGQDDRFSLGADKVSEFLSDSTQATLLFNSFVGGAAIVEYCEGQLEALRINDKYLQVLGTTREAYSGKQTHLLSHFDDENARLLTRAIQRAIATNAEQHCELRSLLNADNGNDIWLSARMRLLAQAGNRYILYLSIDNITKRVRLSEQLADIIDSVPGGILDFEIADRIRTRFFNDALPLMFGYSRDSYRRTFSEGSLDAVHPEDRPALQREIDGILSGREQTMETVYRHACADGSWRHVRLTAHVTKRRGQTIYATGILIDVEQEVAAKRTADLQAAQLARQRVSLQALYDSIPCGVIQFSLTGDKASLLSFNDTAWRLFGYQSRGEYIEDVHAKGRLSGVHPDDQAEVLRAIETLRQSPAGLQLDCDHRIILPDGGVRWLSALFQKVRYENGEESMLAAFSDITERKQTDFEHISSALFSLYDKVYEFDLERDTCYLRASSQPDDPYVGKFMPYGEKLAAYIEALPDIGDQKAVRALFDSAAAGAEGGVLTAEYRRRNGRGALRWISDTIVPLRGSTYLLCRKDVSKDKETGALAAQNEALRAKVLERDREAERNRLIVESTGSLLFEYDPADDTLLIRRPSRDGNTVEEIQKNYIRDRKFESLISADDLARVRGVHFALLRAPGRQIVEYRTTVFGEGFSPCRAQVASVADESGRATRLVGVLTKLDDDAYTSLHRKLVEVAGTDFGELRYDVFTIGQMMKLLDGEPSLHEAINKGLACLGERLNVSRAYIFEDCGDGAHCSNTFEWCNGGVAPEIDNLQNIEYPMGDHGSYLHEFDENGFFVSADIGELPEGHRAILAPQGIRAIAQCAITDAGTFCGFIGVDECAGPRSWPGWQLDTLFVAARVLSSYLFKGRVSERLPLPGAAVRQLEKSPAYAYIVDPDTREVLYANAALASVIGRDAAGETCYKAFMDKDGVCENCPIKAQYAAGAAIPVVLRRRGLQAYMQASPLIWRGRRAMLVCGADATCFSGNPQSMRENLIADEAQQYTRTLAPLFDEIFEIDFDNDRFMSLYTKATRETGKAVRLSAVSAIERWSNHFERDEERERYAAFMNPSALETLFAQRREPFIDYSIRLPENSVRRMRSTMLRLSGKRYLCCNRDITELEKAANLHDELLKAASAAEAESRYDIVVEQTNTAVVEMNYLTGQVTTSPAYARYETSRHSQAALFRNTGSRGLVHPADQEKLAQFFDDSQSGSARAKAVLRVMMTDGAYRFTRITGAYLYDGAGNRTRSIATFTDVDEEVRARLELKAVSERLSRIVDSIPAGVVIYELGEARYPVYISERACEMFGYTREEYDLRIANREPLCFSPDQAALPRGSREILLSGQLLTVPRLLAKKKGGASFWMRAFCSLGRDKDGLPLVYAVVADLTAEIEAENELAWRAEEFRILSESAGIITFDYAPPQDTLRICLPAPGKGVVRETVRHFVRGFARNGHVPDGEKSALIDALMRASRGAVTGSHDFQSNCTGVPRRYRAIYASLADRSGRVFRVVGRLDDITDAADQSARQPGNGEAT